MCRCALAAAYGDALDTHVAGLPINGEWLFTESVAAASSMLDSQHPLLAARVSAHLQLQIGVPSISTVDIVLWHRVAVGQRLENLLRQHVQRVQCDSRQSSDATAVAAWASANATCLFSSLNGRAPVPYAVSIAEVPSCYGMHSLVYTLERDLSRHTCARGGHHLTRLMLRATSHVKRGWSALLVQTLRASYWCRHLVLATLQMFLCGLHDGVCVAERPCLSDRLLLHVYCARVLHTGTLDEEFLISNAEFCRQLVCFMYQTAATDSVAALFAARWLRLPALPLISTSSSGDVYKRTSLAAARAGRRLCESIRRGETVCMHDLLCDMTACNLHNLVVKPAARTTACTAVLRAGAIFSSAFRAAFDPVWLHGLANGCRVKRLDTVQHEILHAASAAVKLCNALPLCDALHAQRQALQHPASHTLSFMQLANVTGTVSKDGMLPNNPVTTVAQLLACGPHALAKFLVYSRVAWLCEQLRVVELGARTCERQGRAVARRHGYADVEQLPTACTTLFICCECRRVCNAHVTDASHLQHGVPQLTASSFTDIGVVSCMLATSDNLSMRCAKRRSASLRAALAAQEAADSRRIDTTAHLSDEHSDKVAQTQHDGRLSARLRRDAKTCFEQSTSATCCGARRLLSVPLMGRAIRWHAAWYAFCARCGAVVQLGLHTQVEAEVCCRRCDIIANKDCATADATHHAQCRYCGRLASRKSAKFVEVKSPNDLHGINAVLAPGLRVTHWCHRHFRPWILTAAQSYDTSVILSHITEKAQPLYAAEQMHNASTLTAADAPSVARPRPRPSNTSRRLSKLAKRMRHAL